MACPRCHRRRGMLKPQGRLGRKLFADIAFTQAKWNVTGTDPDGKLVTVSEAGQSVLRVRTSIPLRHTVWHASLGLWRSDEIGAWSAIHARRWTRRMPTAEAEAEKG